jgi:hypothetical protein
MPSSHRQSIITETHSEITDRVLEDFGWHLPDLLKEKLPPLYKKGNERGQLDL